jgi:hypothetical protein
LSYPILNNYSTLPPGYGMIHNYGHGPCLGNGYIA